MAVPRAVGRLLIGLVLLDAALAWLAIQASFVFLELVWRAVAARDNWRPLVEAHARQFTWLRAVEVIAWLATAAVFVQWLRRIRTSLMATGRLVDGAWRMRPWHPMVQTWRAAVRGAGAKRVPALLGWWWTLLWAVIGVEAWALVRLLVAGSPLELGRGLMLVVVASGLELALAVLTIFVVVALQDGLAAPPPSAP
jgi:hypothetical protein